MARVNTSTLMFEDLTDDEADSLTRLAESIMFGPGLTQTEPLFETWMETSNFDARQRLLVMATVFPARALLSVLRRAKIRETLGPLFEQGDVVIHNVGPDFVLVDFLPRGGTKQHGEGIDLSAALANLGAVAAPVACRLRNLGGSEAGTCACRTPADCVEGSNSSNPA